MIRTPLIVIWVVLVTIYFSISVVIVSFITKSGDMPNKVVAIWARLILAASRIKVEVIGLSNIDPAKSYLYMSNHQGNFDIPIFRHIFLFSLDGLQRRNFLIYLFLAMP